MSDSSPSDVKTPLAQVREYHQRTKHRFEGYARGPETLDWDAQPAPFRHFTGVDCIRLPRLSEIPQDSALHQALQRPFAHLGQQKPLPIDLQALGAWLQLSLGLTAWKTYGPDRWAVRANPSSGNLHPTEAYVWLRSVPDVADGLYHYDPEHHQLECRALHPTSANTEPQVGVVLTSVMWREMWKYGERAFRYCQLDTGHAMGALSYAAAALGWQLSEQAHIGSQTLAQFVGVDRESDFPARRAPETEREEAEVLLCIGSAEPSIDSKMLHQLAQQAQWQGTASTIDPYPMYRWPVVAEVARSTRAQDQAPQMLTALPNASGNAPQDVAVIGQQPIQHILVQRRSAQRFDADHSMSLDGFNVLLSRVRAMQGAPWDVMAHAPRIALLIFVMRVEGLSPGLYLLPRTADLLSHLSAGLASEHRLQPVPEIEGLFHLRAFELLELKRLSRSLHCHQDLAGSACLAFGMLARFDQALSDEGAAGYRSLYREAGLIGQALYLQAEAQSLRGTGIGCFFDDPVHTLVGVEGTDWQSLYHFTLGLPVLDARIETTPAYTDDLSFTQDT